MVAFNVQPSSFQFTLFTGRECTSQIGCFTDVEADRDLNAHSPTLGTVNALECRTACKTVGYPYAALQAGTDCRCDLTYGKHGSSTGNERLRLVNHLRLWSLINLIK